MPFQRQGGAQVVAFGGVVVDDVEDDLDPRSVQRLDERLELVDLAAGVPGGRVLVVRCEESESVVAPVVAQSFVFEMGVLGELVHGHEFDSGDAERGQAFDRCRMREAGVRSAELLGNPGMLHREALDVGLVDDRLRQPGAGRVVVAPVETVRVGDHSEHHVAGAIRRVLYFRVVQLVREHRLRPVVRAADRGRVRVEQHLRRVEAQTRSRIPGAVDTEPVPCARRHAVHEPVEDMPRAAQQRRSRLRAVVGEDADFDSVGALAVDGDIGPALKQSDAEGIGKGSAVHAGLLVSRTAQLTSWRRRMPPVDTAPGLR